MTSPTRVSRPSPARLRRIGFASLFGGPTTSSCTRTRRIVPRDGASLLEEPRARGGARLRRICAHRPRRRLRLPEFAYAAMHFGVRPITGAEVTLMGNTRRFSARRGTATELAVSSPMRTGHAHTGKERDLLCRDDDRDARAACGRLVALSGCARHGLGSVDPNASAGLHAFEARSMSSCSDRTSAAMHAATLVSTSWRVRSESRLSQQATCTRITSAGRACRTRLSRSRTARRSTVASVNGGGTTRACCSHRRRCWLVSRGGGVANARGRRPVPLRSHAQEPGYRYPDFSDRVDPADRQLEAICQARFADRYQSAGASIRTRARERCATSSALIAQLGLSGFFLLHWEARARATCALEVRGPGSPRHALLPGEGAARRSARSSAT
jgi:hypothetical protein